MGDNKRWFKFWVSAANAFHAQGLSMEQIGRWAILGALTAEIGHSGVLVYDAENLKTRLGIVTVDALHDALKVYENVHVKYDENSNGKITVIFGKWAKYQEDSTSSERQAKHRKRQNSNGLRREEKRRDFKDVGVVFKDSILEEKVFNAKSAFETIWLKYPLRVGKKQSLRHFQASVKDSEALKQCELALENYKVFAIEQNRPWQNGATWFNNWQDWIIKPDPNAQVSRETTEKTRHKPQAREPLERIPLDQLPEVVNFKKTHGLGDNKSC